MALLFSKMHGAGNDFAVLDCRGSDALPDADTLRLMGHRHFGIGFDQLLTSKSRVQRAPWRLTGSSTRTAVSPGNAAMARVAWRTGWCCAASPAKPRLALDSPAGLIRVSRGGPNRYTLNMGRPRFAPDDVPLVAEQASLTYQLPFDGHHIVFSAVSMGNPHAVIQVESCFDAPVERWGQAVQASHVFPEGVNVGFAEVVTRKHIRLRVFERGVGETLACGSGACAAAVSLIRLGLVEPALEVHLPGGVLEIEWAGDGADVLMTGPALLVYEGEWLND